MKDGKNSNQVTCPFCNYKMPLRFCSFSSCFGVTMRCKNRNCKKEFELIIYNGRQVLNGVSDI